MTFVDARPGVCMPPRFSLVIPAYNEECLLPRLLDSVDAARSAYGDRDAIEVIVADNLSTDRTAQFATERGCRVAPVGKRVIAAARNGGAKVALGEIVGFIDADSQLHPQTFIEIDRAFATGRCIGGATGVRMERWSLGIAFTYAIIIPMVLLTGLDGGVAFCRKQDFDALGGYDESLALAEDVAFLWALRKLGKTRGQRLMRMTRAKAIASTRKFDEFGDWHYFRFAGEYLRYGKTKFADKYWYKPKR
jgi:glycosyltransferase involved in cell wall biosynthesis